MALTDREREILQELEEQFVRGGGRLDRLLHRRHGRWRDGAGWLLLLVGGALVLGLLVVSVLASFAAFMVSMVGLWLVAANATGRAVRRGWGAAVARIHKPPDSEVP